MNWKQIESLLLLAAVGVALSAPGCKKEEEKKAVPAKVETEEQTKQAKEEIPKEPTESKAPGEGKGPVEEKHPVKEPEKKVPPPTAREELKKVMGSFPAYSYSPGKVEAYLKGLRSVAEKFPGTPEESAALVEGLKVRADFVILGLGGEHPDLPARLMELDGKLEAGKASGDKDVAAYCKELAAQLEESAGRTEDPKEASVLKGKAALLAYLAAKLLEGTGEKGKPAVEIPSEWKKSGPSSGSVPEALGGVEGPGATKTGGTRQPGARDEGGRVLKKGERATTGGAGAGESAGAPAALETPEAKEAPKSGTTPVLSGAALLKLAEASSPVVVEARYVVLGKIREALQKAVDPDFLGRWTALAQAMGGLVCDVCGQLDQVKPQYVGDALFLPKNTGIVCPEAIGDIQAGMSTVEAVRKNCLAYFGLSAEDVNLLEPVNALVLRFLKITSDMLKELPEAARSNKLYSDYSRVATDVADALPGLVGLTPPVELFPKEKWEEMKERLVLRSDLSTLSPSFSFQPVEMLVIDEFGVSRALRPMAKMKEGAAVFAERGTELGYPGKLIATVEQIEKELEEKHKALKERKVPYDESLGAFLEEVTIRGTVFKKPDFSIPSVVEAAKALPAVSEDLESIAFPYLAGMSVVNRERPNWPEFPDTVGRASLYLVDIETPALLFKRVLDSLYHADYKDDRLFKGTGHMGTVPTVYFSEKFIAPEALDMTYKRPILVFVTQSGTVRFYPPTNSTRKGKMSPNRRPRQRDIPWPRKYNSVEDPRIPDPLWNLFMAYTRAGSKNFESDVQGIALAMKKKWDNGNVIYLIADDKAPSGLVVKVADLLHRIASDTPIQALDKAFPGYTCDLNVAPELCPTNIIVLFPDVEIPHLPGKKKIQEAELNVYCDQKDIAAKINAKRGAIKFCYDPELQKNPQLQGKVVFKFTIGETGRVTEISVEKNELGNDTVVECTKKVIKGITFRRPIGGQCVIRYPYVFKP